MSILKITFGPMFSGKTTNLLKDINDFLVLNNEKKVLIINSSLDNRLNKIKNLTTHKSSIKILIESDNINYISVKNLNNIDILSLNEYSYIAIDECQFFEEIEDFIKKLIKLNKYIHCVGLLSNISCNKFGNLHNLFYLADEIKQLKSFCKLCRKKNAIFTSLKDNNNNNNNIIIGGEKIYEATCRNHFH